MHNAIEICVKLHVYFVCMYSNYIDGTMMQYLYYRYFKNNNSKYCTCCLESLLYFMCHEAPTDECNQLISGKSKIGTFFLDKTTSI